MVAETSSLREEAGKHTAEQGTASGADTLNRLADLLVDCGRYDDAREYEARLQQLVSPDSNPVLWHRSSARSARSLVLSGRFAEARSLVEELLSIADIPTPVRAEYITILALAEVHLGNTWRAVELCKQAVRVSGDPRIAGEAFRALGWAQNLFGSPRKALMSFAKSRRCFTKAGSDYEEIRALLDQAVLLKNFGRGNRAARIFGACLRRLRKSSYPVLHASALRSIANLNIRNGRPERAVRHLTQSLSIIELIVGPIPECSARISMAKCLRLLGREAEAATEISKARALALSTGHQRMLALVCEEEGELALRADNLSGAEHAYQEGLRIAEAIAPECDVVAELARRLADVRLVQGRLEEAASLVTRALSVSRDCDDKREEGTCYRTLARLAKTEEQQSRARSQYDRGVAAFRLIGDRIELATTLEERALLHPASEKDLGEAASLYRRAGMIEDEKRVQHLKANSRTTTTGTKTSSPDFAADPFFRIITRSPKMLDVIEVARRLAPAGIPILIRGETGVGKELFAQSIGESRGNGSSFIPVNCAALPGSLLESELFGHKRGAYTGAGSDKKGLLEIAQGGTVFLDEIDKASVDLQAKLLRFLDLGEIRRVGETRTRLISVRVLSATNRDLEKLAGEGDFLPDLLYRLRGAELLIPPLRDREGDIELLARHFLDSISLARRHEIRFSENCLLKMEDLAWRGNVRELKMEVERLSHIAKDALIRSGNLNPASPTRETLSSLRSDDKKTILSALRHFDGDTDAAATHLGIARSTLYRRIKKNNIQK